MGPVPVKWLINSFGLLLFIRVGVIHTPLLLALVALQVLKIGFLSQYYQLCSINVNDMPTTTQLMHEADELLTYADVAKYLHCSKVFIWKMRREGKIKAVIVARKVLFQKSSIDEFLKSNQEGGKYEKR